MILFERDLAIDLGTTNVRIAARGKGVILQEPSVVAMDKNSGRLLKYGMEAQKMLGRTPANIVAIDPMKAGAISDYEMTERMLREMVKSVTSFSLLKPRMLIGVPSGISEVEERAVIDAGMEAGARKVYLMETPLAAALGAGLDLSGADGKMLVDVGGGTTDVAVLSLNGVVESDSVKVAGDSFNEDRGRDGGGTEAADLLHLPKRGCRLRGGQGKMPDDRAAQSDRAEFQRNAGGTGGDRRENRRGGDPRP